MAEQGCNYCNPKLRTACISGQYNLSFTLDGQKCAVCGSRPRIRAMAQAVDLCLAPKLSELGLKGAAKSLLIGAPAVEMELLQPLVGEIVHGSLYGEYAENHVTTDVRDLKEFSDQSFDLLEACTIFDFVPEAEAAFESISRVLKTKSIVFFHINDGRLRDSDAPPWVKRYRTDWTASYYPEGYQQPIVIFGRQWIHNKLTELGFEVRTCVWQDPGLKKSLTWWLAWRG